MEYREIPLTKGHVARVSPEDYDDVSARRWRVMDTKVFVLYAIGSVKDEEGRYRTVGLHAYIMREELAASPRGSVVSHLDGNGLNCVRPNLRVTTQAANVQHDKDRHAAERLAVKVAKDRAATDYLTTLRDVRAAVRASGLSEEAIAARVGYRPEGIASLLACLHRSPSMLDAVRAVVSASEASL